MDIGSGASCTTAAPGFDIKLGVGVKHSKGMEYRETKMEFYLVKADGTTRYVNYAFFDDDDKECYKLDNRSPSVGYSKYYKDPTLRASVRMYVHFEYYIDLGDPKFEVAPEPEFTWTAPNEVTLKLSNTSLTRINSNQMVNTNESTRLGLRNCGIESSSVNTNYYM